MEAVEVLLEHEESIHKDGELWVSIFSLPILYSQHNRQPYHYDKNYIAPPPPLQKKRSSLKKNTIPEKFSFDPPAPQENIMNAFFIKQKSFIYFIGKKSIYNYYQSYVFRCLNRITINPFYVYTNILVIFSISGRLTLITLV